MSRFGLLAIACTIVTCGSAFAQPGFARKVYAHYVPWHPPSHARPDRTANAAAGTAGQIESAAEAGVDGFAVDAVLTPPERIIPTIVDMAEAAKERAPGFEVFPCLDLAAAAAAPVVLATLWRAQPLLSTLQDLVRNRRAHLQLHLSTPMTTLEYTYNYTRVHL